MLPPTKQESRMDKKGFCKANLTKQPCFSQERLTELGQETLTKHQSKLRCRLFLIIIFFLVITVTLS